jgi:hypothetical protein
MIKLKIGEDGPDGRGSIESIEGVEGGMESPNPLAASNNVEAPVDDDGHDGSDQERAIGSSGDKDAQQRASQQQHADSTDPESTAKGASGHRSGGPKKDKGQSKHDDKDSHHGVSLDEEAKERQTGEGGPVNSGTRRGGEHGHAGR